LSWTVDNVGADSINQAWSDEIFLSTKSTFDSTARSLLTQSAADVIPLAAGAYYQRTATITLPLDRTTISGTYYVLVETDALGQVPDPTITDNFGSQAIALTLPPLPDLTPGSLSLPAQGYNGQKIVVSWIDANGGTAGAVGPWTDNIYLAGDAQGDNAALVGQATFPNLLAIGQTVPLAQPIYLPATPGTYYLEVVADASGINEGPNALNNATVDPLPITVVVEPLPDLVVTSITPPANVVAGTTAPVTYTVTNNGNAPTNAAQWLDAIFISQSPSLTLSPTNDLQFGVGAPLYVPVLVTNPSYLLPGQSYSQTVDVPFPYSASGTWYVYVATNRSFTHTPLDNFIDPGPVVESNSTNDMTLGASFPVTLAPLPDLAVAPVQTPLEAFSGQPLTVSWSVTNNGAGMAIGQSLVSASSAPAGPVAPTLPASSTWTDEVFLSPDASLDSKAISLGTFPFAGALQPGAGYTQAQQVTLPVGVSGSYYFIVETDINGQVFESGSSAHEVNATPSAVTVNLTPPPDLQTTIRSAPAAGLASHAFNFTYQVTNSGAGATELSTPAATWTDSFYLSPTSTFNAGTAILLGQQTVTSLLDAGAGYQNTIAETLGNGLFGTYYLIVNADSGNAVFELDKTGKLGVSTSAITVASMPADLVVSAASAPETGNAGSALLVNWTVTNQGSGDTAVASWQDDVYADTGSTLSSKGILLGSYTHTGLLEAGGSYTQSQLVTLPINLSGPYNLFVVTDQPAPPQPGQNPGPPPVYETSYSDDTSAALPITVNQQLASLQLMSVTGPSAATTGGSATVDWTVQNNGSAITNSNYWYDDVWLSTHTTLQSGGADYYLGTLQHSNPLAAADSYSASLTVTIPPVLAAGTYYFVVAVDRPVVPPGKDSSTVNLVFESSETGNLMASSAAGVTLGPNLAVSAVTAPSTLNVDQPLAVGWTVTNTGAGDTGNIPIQDSVYLSYDQVLSDSSIYVGTVTETGGLTAGAHYTQSATLTLPSGLEGTFYVFVVTDTNQSVFEQDANGEIAFDSTALVIQATPPADLVAGAVTIPANAVPGQDITINYQVANNGSNPANGAWTDLLYLSPTQTWSVSDPLLGTVAEDRNLAAGASYTGTLTAPLPAVHPGSYYVILRTNILDTIPETALTNNLSASLTQTSIDVPALTPGTPATGTLGDRQSAFYKATVEAGQTLQIRFTSQAADSLNELYVSYGSMPARGQADLNFGSFAANQQITVPATLAGTYYILAHGNDVPGSAESYSLVAAIIAFSVTAASPGTVGNAGPSTMEIDGAKFERGTTFQLIDKNGTIIQTSSAYVHDASKAFATFDLTGKPIGAYDVQATQSDGTTVKLAAGLTVAAGTGGRLETNMSVPSVVLPGEIGTFTVNYRNTGDGDIAVPLLTVESPTGTLMDYTPTGVDDSSLTFLGTSADGPAGILRPGASASRRFTSRDLPTAEIPTSSTSRCWPAMGRNLSTGITSVRSSLPISRRLPTGRLFSLKYSNNWEVPLAILSEFWPRMPRCFRLPWAIRRMWRMSSTLRSRRHKLPSMLPSPES
jgi:hypothetical protein